MRAKLRRSREKMLVSRYMFVWKEKKVSRLVAVFLTSQPAVI